MNQTATREGGFFYGWVIVGIATFALVVSNGIAIGGIAVFYEFIQADLVASGAIAAAQKQSLTGTAGAITFFMAGLAAFPAGYLLKRLDIRTMLIIGCFILGSALLVYSRAESANIVYLAHTLFGVSLGFVGVLVNTVLVSSWFRRYRGTAIGILLTGTSIGGFLIPRIATPLILNYGWRTTMLIVSLLVWLILLPAVIFLVKNKPSDLGLEVDGDSTGIGQTEEEFANSAAQPATGMTLRQAVKTPIFWVFAVCAALIFYPIFVTGQQFVLYLRTERIGLSPVQASWALSLLYVLSIGGKFFFGWLSDRFPPARVMLVCCILMFAATLVLLNLTANTAFGFLIPFGLGYGGTFVLLNLLIAEYFGLKEYGKILGAITVIETIGGAAGTIVTSRIADANGGDYTQAFYGVIIANGLALITVVLLNLMIGKRQRTI
jgi:sugar phosphate permease